MDHGSGQPELGPLWAGLGLWFQYVGEFAEQKRKGINRASRMNKWVGSSLLCLMRWPGPGHLLKAQLGPGDPSAWPMNTPRFK